MTSMHTTNNWPYPLRIVYRYRMRFVMSMLGVMMSVWAIAAMFPRTFEASSRFRRPNVATLTPANRSTTDSLVTPLRQTLEEDFKGPPTLEAAVDDPSLPFAATFVRTEEGKLTATGRKQRQRLIDNLAPHITVHTITTTAAMDIVKVTVRSDRAETSVQLVNFLVDHYLVEARHRLNERIRKMEDFLAHQTDRQQQKIAGLRQTKIQLEHDHPTLRPDEAAALRERLIAARAELRSIDQQLIRLDQEHAALSQWASDQPQYLEQRTRGRNPKIAHLNAQKSKLEQDLSEHRYKWGRTDDHPLVQKTLTKIESIDLQLASTPKIIDLVAQRQTNATKLEAEAKLKSLAAIRQTLGERRGTLESEAEQFEAVEQAGFAGRSAYDQIIESLAEAHRELEFWQTRKRNAMLGRSTGRVDLSVIQRASASGVMAFPRRELADMIALLLGLTAGIGSVVFAHRSHRSFDHLQTAYDELGIPILGAVAQNPPQENTHTQKTPLREAA